MSLRTCLILLTITPNVVLFPGGGTPTSGGAGPDYDTSDFIAVSPSTVYKGLRDTNTALSFRVVWGFYTSSKTYISILDFVSTLLLLKIVRI